MVCAPVRSIIPSLSMVCAPVRSIIPSLKLGDYLSVQAHNPCSISHLVYILNYKIEQNKKPNGQL